MTTLADRFWAKVDKTEGCWNWTAAVNGDGYGLILVNRVACLAHRVAWRLVTGVDPGEMQVLHSCDNPGCVRFGHLFLGTHTDNMRDCARKGRNVQSKKTHCPKGHAYTAENTNVVDGRRECRTCRLAGKRDRRKRNYVLHPRATKTHCAAGHPFDDANTRRDGCGHRVCRRCATDATARYRERQRSH